MTWDTSARHGTDWKPRGYARLRLDIFAAHHWRCVDCGQQHDAKGLELDHDNGNRHDWRRDNLRPRCRPCHQRKTQREAAAARPSRNRKPEPHPGLLS